MKLDFGCVGSASSVGRIIVPSVSNVNTRAIQQWHWLSLVLGLPVVIVGYPWFPVVIVGYLGFHAVVSSGYLGFQWLSLVSSNH